MTDHKPPRIDNAPGIIFKKRKYGWYIGWQARTDLVTAGWEPKSRQLAQVRWEPTQAEKDWIAEECRYWQNKMLAWSVGGVPTMGSYDGTIRGLVFAYQNDPESDYQNIRHATRVNYDVLLGHLVREYGGEVIADIKARQIKAWHRGWAENRGVPTARNLITILRVALTFGATILEDDECIRARALLSAMKFKAGEARKDVLTSQMADAIRSEAHKVAMPEIALAQAFQFECTLRQKDCIGEWVPLKEKGTTDVVNEVTGEKWLRGIRWSEIDDRLILRHVTSKRDKEIEVNLLLAPMVIEEMNRSYMGAIERHEDGTIIVNRHMLPAAGPLIVNPDDGLPYRNYLFRRRWRKCAVAVGVPKSVKNMDSRAGAITEATDSGASLEDVRHAATHSNISMTQRYSRNTAKKTATVMQLRVASRNKG